LHYSLEDDVFENSDEIDDVINYQDGVDDFDHMEEVDLVVTRANPFDNASTCECLPLVESFQLTNLNDLSEQETQAKNNLKDLLHHENLNSSKTIYDENNNNNNNVQNDQHKDMNDERSNEIEEEIKSISSIEGSLKGLSSNSNYEVLSGLSSSTPLHLYPKIGK
jgi:hypothetical protein